MRFSASSLSFGGLAVNKMAQLPESLGIEIFAEWGSNSYWQQALAHILRDRSGGFSVHSPFTHADISVPCEDNKLFSELMESFELYHKYNGEFYVVHTNGHLNYPYDPIVEEERRKLAVDRLIRFNECCKREGIRMAVENLGFCKAERILFNQQQFLQIFADAPQLKCLIDTGHALLADYNIYEIQQALGERLIAYHVHDNNGLTDQHLRIGQGKINWNLFAEGYACFTPNANIVMEYNAAEIEDYSTDRARLQELIGRY